MFGEYNNRGKYAKELNFFDETSENKSKEPEKTISIISDLGYNLSEQSNLCELIGREEEIKKIVKNVCIRNKSVILVGPSGCGKTSIVEKLALDIKNQENKWLNNKIIFSLNTSMLQQNTKYRGEFEEKINKLIENCKNNNIIIFIDEIHTLHRLGVSEDGALDAINIFKPYISRGDITIIGATTDDEYTEYMTKDLAFLSRIEKINISLPNNELNMQILLSYIEELEKKYQIILKVDNQDLYNLINFILNITDRKNQKIIGDIKVTNPRLAKDIIENAFVEAIYNQKKEVTIDDICFAIIDCDKLSLTFRKEKAIELKKIIIERKNSVNITSKKELIKVL